MNLKRLEVKVKGYAINVSLSRGLTGSDGALKRVATSNRYNFLRGIGGRGSRRSISQANTFTIWTVLGPIIGVLVGGLLSFVSSAYQVQGTQEGAAAQFLRTQQQTAYVQYELDQDTLISAEDDLASSLQGGAQSDALKAGAQKVTQAYTKYGVDVENVNFIGSYRVTLIVHDTWVLHTRLQQSAMTLARDGRLAASGFPNDDIQRLLNPLDLDFKGAARSDLGVS